MPLSTLTCYNLQKADIMFGLLQVPMDDTAAIRKTSIALVGLSSVNSVNRCLIVLRKRILMYMRELGRHLSISN